MLPEPAVKRHVRLDEAANTLTVAGRTYNLDDYNRIVVVGGGKAGRRTGSELVNILGDRITAGVLNVYQEQAREPISGNIKLFAANHPTPNEAGVEGARRMVELLKSADPSTLVIALISGGGSSLMALPVAGISLEDYVAIINLLLTVPATIDEVNAVRKHLDPLKGGGMRKMAKDAGGFISLVLSDVPVTKTGVVDDPSVISSGPTVGDDSTFASAKKVLTDHNIWDQAPPAVKEYIEENLGKEENETLPMDSPLLAADKSQYVIIANNDLAMEAAGEKAGQLGYAAHLIGWKTGSVADKIKAEVTREIENIWKVDFLLSDRSRPRHLCQLLDGRRGRPFRPGRGHCGPGHAGNSQGARASITGNTWPITTPPRSSRSWAWRSGPARQAPMWRM